MKSVKKNYFYNLAYQLLIMFLPLITTPYLSRTLGAENIGIYGFTTSILSYFVLFGCLGINTYGQREIAFVQDDKEKRSKIFYELVILKTLLLLLSFIVFAVFNYNDSTYGLFYKILTIELFSNVVDITWFYQGLEDFKKITIRNTIVRLVSLALIFIFVKDSSDLIIYFLIMSITNFVGFLILWLNLKNHIVKISFKSINFIKHIKYSFMLFLPQIAIQIYTVLDKTMIGFFYDDMSHVGYYDQAHKLAKLCLLLITAMGTVMIPRIANLFANNKDDEINSKIEKVFNLVSFLSFPICFGLIATSNTIVPWFFGDGYLPVINLLMIFSFLLIAIGFNNITGVQYLISVKKQNIFTVSVVTGAITNFLLNLILIPRFAGLGAAIASVVAEFTILTFHIIYLRKVFNFKKIFKENVRYLILSLVMFAAVYPVGIALGASFWVTCLQIVVGILIYLIGLVLIKDNLLSEILRMIKKILRVK